jgi:hypothetical protein
MNRALQGTLEMPLFSQIRNVMSRWAACQKEEKRNMNPRG